MAPFEINPSISQLVENTQKFSPDVGKKGKDNLKTRKKKTGKVYGGSTTDSTNLSDDMLGDMDPDDYHGRDHSSEFKQQMESWREEAEKKEKKNKDKQDDEDLNEDSNESSLKEDIYSYKEQKEPKKTQKSIREKDEHQVKETKNKTGKDVVEETKRRIREKQRKRNRRSIDIDDIPDVKEEKQNQQIKENKNATSSISKEKIEISLKRETKKEIKSKKNEFVSLLGYDDGFIIADPWNKPISNNDTIDIIPSEEIDSQEEKTIEISKPVQERYEKVFAEIILTGIKDNAYIELCKDLQNFGIGVLETCRDNQERILFLSKDQTLESFSYLVPEANEEAAYKIRFGYFPSSKLVVLGKEILIDKDPRVNIPILYFAFAYDHALGDEAFASERSPAVKANFGACKSKIPGHQFIDSFCTISSVHYFAQSIEAYLTPPRDQIKDPVKALSSICTCEELYDRDRSMYMYIDYLFKNANRNEDDPYRKSYKFKGIV